jgi:Uma2 family endonuclease
VFVVRWSETEAPEDWSEIPLPLLVIEVLSPPTARYDRQVKRRWFQHAGVPEYWIVDPDARQVERWRPADERPEVLDDSMDWMPIVSGPSLVIDLVEFFRDTLGPTD